MLNTLIVNSFDNGILWVGSQFDNFHHALRRLYTRCDFASSSYEALCHLEQCRISNSVFPLIVVEQSVTHVDRHTLIRVLKNVPEMACLDIIFFGEEKLDGSLAYSGQAKTKADLNFDVQVFTDRPQPVIASDDRKKLAVESKLLLLENNSTRRLIAKGLLTSLKVEHDIFDHLDNSLKPHEYDICMVSEELLDMPDIEVFISQCQRCVVMGNRRDGFESIGIPLREKDLLSILSGVALAPLSPPEAIIQAPTQMSKLADGDFDIELDLDEMSTRLGVSEDIAMLVVKTYFKDLFNQIASVEQAIESSDALKLKSIAHIIKGSSSTIGAHELSGFAASVEKIADKDIKDKEVQDATLDLACKLLETLKAYETAIADLLEKDRGVHG